MAEVSSSLFTERNETRDALLERIKTCLPALEELQREMMEAELSGFFRFYHSDLRVHDLCLRVERAAGLLHAIAGEGDLALQFETIIQGAVDGRLDLTSARMWILSALPVLAAFAHCKTLVGMHLAVRRELMWSPDESTLAWATLLCLYGLH